MAEKKKLENLAHYIISKIKDPETLGATKLNKILWYVDAFTYRQTGSPVTEAIYVKNKYGPVPDNIKSVLHTLKKGNKISITSQKARYKPRLYKSLKEPDVKTFSAEDLGLADYVIKEITENYTAKSISDLTHDAVWKAAVRGEKIPYFAVLSVYEGELSDKDRSRATEVVHRVVSRMVDEPTRTA